MNVDRRSHIGKRKIRAIDGEKMLSAKSQLATMPSTMIRDDMVRGWYAPSYRRCFSTDTTTEARIVVDPPDAQRTSFTATSFAALKDMHDSLRKSRLWSSVKHACLTIGIICIDDRMIWFVALLRSPVRSELIFTYPFVWPVCRCVKSTTGS